MKKVAIVTIISQNYGNRLQNYALQETLKKGGVEVETIPLTHKSNFERQIKFVVKKVLAKIINNYAEEINWNDYDQ